MPLIKPPRTQFKYELMKHPDGRVVVGKFEDGGVYYNIMGVNPRDVSTSSRVVARTETLEDANLLITALQRHTVKA